MDTSGSSEEEEGRKKKGGNWVDPFKLSATGNCEAKTSKISVDSKLHETVTDEKYIIGTKRSESPCATNSWKSILGRYYNMLTLFIYSSQSSLYFSV